MGGSVILLGLFLSQFRGQRQAERKTAAIGVDSAQMEQAIEAKMGFKGI
jgi:hypothetical protein